MHGHNSFTVCLSNVQQTFTLRWFVYMDCYQSQDSHFTVCALLIASPFLEFLNQGLYPNIIIYFKTSMN